MQDVLLGAYLSVDIFDCFVDYFVIFTIWLLILAQKLIIAIQNKLQEHKITANYFFD